MAGEEDQRKVISSNQIQNFPFNCIGVLKGRDKRNRPVFATGFLISDRFVLTSAHIIYIMTNRHEFNSNDLSFQLFDHEHLNIKSFKISNDYLNIQREI
jgi:V8-like Glu-specific endopeptidase